MILFWFSMVLLVLLAVIAFEVVRSEKHVIDLAARKYEDRDWPKVSIIVSARNEQDSIEHAVLTLLNLDYPNLELIVVDDRSTDRTGAILVQLHSSRPQLRTLKIDELPPGWLGKCNAMHQGANAACGEWLLFTDADVSMKPATIKAAIDFAIAEQADHLTLAPRCELPSWWLRAFVATFVLFFKLYVRPSRIKDPQSKTYVGIGAFNLVRRETYIAIGGYEAIRLRPDDDIKLGKLVKLAGYRQRFANGLGMISVPWYRTFGELMRGLEKNSFAGIDYSRAKWVGSNIVIFTLFVLPFLLVWFSSGASFWLLTASCVLILWLGMDNAVGAGYRFHHGLCFPVGVLLFLFVLDRAILLSIWRRGIIWREDFYPLDELKKNVVCQSSGGRRASP
jgi:glycosyltransferase involved in cell wall biosynthesis